MIKKALKGFATVNLRSLKFTHDPRRFVTYLHELDGLHQTHIMPPLQPITLTEIVGENYFEPMFLPVGRVRNGSTPLQDLAAMAAIVRYKKPTTIFEIGTFEGSTAVVFIKNSEAGVRLHTLDLPHEKEVTRTERSYSAHSIGWSYASGHLIDEFGIREQVDTIFGDSALFDFTPFHDQVDLFFVDGAHTEDYVISDSAHAFECIGPDGWVLWHDCFNPHVLKGLKEVARAVKIMVIAGTNLAIAMGKPGVHAIRELARRQIH